MLADLIAYYTQVDKPTIIVFFGDHFPGFDQQLTQTLVGDNQLLTWQAPFIIWKNYQDDSELPINYGLTSAFHLSHLLLTHSCQNLPPFFQFLAQQYQITKGYNSQIAITDDGQAVDLMTADPSIQQARDQHWLWQYDLLFGKQYSLL